MRQSGPPGRECGRLQGSARGPKGRGSLAAGIHSVDSCSREKKCTESVSPPSSSPDRPSPKRLPGGRAFNLGRSVLGALGKLLAHSDTVKAPKTDSVANCDISIFMGLLGRTRAIGSVIPRKNAPRPTLLRPVSRLTAAEAAVRLEPINLRCSVLGAIGRLGPRAGRVKEW